MKIQKIILSLLTLIGLIADILGIYTFLSIPNTSKNGVSNEFPFFISEFILGYVGVVVCWFFLKKYDNKNRLNFEVACLIFLTYALAVYPIQYGVTYVFIQDNLFNNIVASAFVHVIVIAFVAITSYCVLQVEKRYSQ